MIDDSSEGCRESTITLKWGVVIMVIVTGIVALLGWSFGTVSNHDVRLTKIETRLEIVLPALASQLGEMQVMIKDIRDEQVFKRLKNDK